MKVKFNKFERLAGLFVIGAFCAMLFALVGVAAKQGWFDSRTEYSTTFDEADGIHTGTTVQLAGLRAGAVEKVELTENNKIHVRFYVFSKFNNKIRADSTAQMVRPFVIGDRMLEVSVGSESQPELGPLGQMPGLESVDLMTLMSGRKLGAYMGSIGEATKNLRHLAEAFLDKSRTENLVKIFDRINPLLENMNVMAIEVTKLTRQGNKDERFGVVMREMATLAKELGVVLPIMKEKSPQMFADTQQLISNLSQLTEQFKLLTPAFTEIAPELPRASRRAIEALDETVVLLKAMQKSFFLKSNAQEVREEEKKRKPADER